MPPIAEDDSVTVDSAPVAPVPTPNVVADRRQAERQHDQVERVQHVARERGAERVTALLPEGGEPALRRWRRLAARAYAPAPLDGTGAHRDPFGRCSRGVRIPGMARG